jgi:hypothetical protein
MASIAVDPGILAIDRRVQFALKLVEGIHYPIGRQGLGRLAGVGVGDLHREMEKVIPYGMESEPYLFVPGQSESRLSSHASLLSAGWPFFG